MQNFGNKIHLEIGGGDNPVHFCNVHMDSRDLPGVDIISDATTIPLDDRSCVEIYAANVLEHISWTKTDDTLKEWARVLEPGGKIVLYVPDFDLIKNFGDKYIRDTFRFVYGDQDYDDNYHKAGFTEKTLTNQLVDAGFKEITRLPRSDNWSLHIEAYKI